MTKENKATTHRLRLATPSKEDFKTMWAFFRHLQHIEGAYQFGDAELIGWSDSERRHLKALGLHYEKNGAALSRIIMSLETLMSPTNEIIDPSLDYLEFHPRLKKAFKLLDMVETESAFNFLKPIMICEQALKSTQLCRQCDDPDAPDEDCELCGGEGDYEETHVIDWTTQKETLSMAFVAMLKEAGSDE